MTSTLPRYVGVVEMGANYSSPYWDGDAYVWDTLDDVRASLWSIARGAGVAARVAEWSDDESTAHRGHYDDSLTPCATPTILLAVNDGAPDTLRNLQNDGPYACDYAAYVGPRGGLVVTRDIRRAMARPDDN